MNIIALIWFFCAIFNAIKIIQTDGKDVALFEGLFAIFLSPIYTFIAFVLYFVWYRWPHGCKPLKK